MKKFIAPLGALCLTLVLSGCGSDLREVLISGTIEKLNKAKTSLPNIKTNVAKWDKETKDAEKTKLLKSAMDGTNSLRGVARELQEIKQATGQLDPTTKEQREEYLQKYRDRLGSAVEGLKKEQTGLNDALIMAEKNHPQLKTALAELKQKLQLAQSEFDVLTKQQ